MKDGYNKNPKGKLYAKYYNSMRTLKTSGLVPCKEQVKTVKLATQRKHDNEFGKIFLRNYLLIIKY